MKKYLLLLTASLTLTASSNLTNAQGTWTQRADFGGGLRENAVSFSIGTKGYMGLGNVQTTITLFQDMWEYDPSTNVWTQKANFGGGPRADAVAFTIGSYAYVGTGICNIFPYDKRDFWKFDPSNNTWIQIASFGGSSRDMASAFSIGSFGYVGTGNDSISNMYTNDFWKYDPALNLWTQIAPFPGTDRFTSIALSISGKGYFGLGCDAGQFPCAVGDFWEYDPTSNSWTQKANFGGSARNQVAGFTIGNKGYIGTGADNNAVRNNDFWEYDPIANAWTQLANFGGVGRNAATGFSISNKGYIGTGHDGTTDLQDFWEYSPLLGIEENSSSSTISIFPNPFFSQTALQTAKPLKNASLTVHNSVGQTVKHIDNLSGQTIVFHRDNLPSGLYFVRLTQDGNTISSDKFVITDK